MNYPNGQPIRLGDRVALGEDRSGEVVCSIDDDAYTEAFPKAAWAYLRQGVLIQFETYGVIHYREAEPGLTLLAREVGDR